MKNIGNTELQDLLKDKTQPVCLLDVRTPQEYALLGHIPGARLLPVQELPMAFTQLDPERRTVVICQHGVRSFDAALFLQAQGFRDILNHEFGMADWDGPLEYGHPQPASSVPEQQ